MASTHIQLDDRLSELSRLERQLQDEIAETKRRKNDLLPISRLSVELLSEIFVISTTGDWDPPSSNPDRDHKTQYRRGCIIISQVSGSWRAVALGLPEIWANIGIRTTTKNRLLKYMMKNAGPVALSVTILPRAYVRVSASYPLYPRAWGTIDKMVTSSPIKSLIFLPSDCDRFPHFLLSSFPSGSETVQTLEVHGRPLNRLYATTVQASPSNLLPQGPPNLRRLVVWGNSCIPWKSPLLTQSPNLTSLLLTTPGDTTVAQVLFTLRRNVRLQELRLVLPDKMEGSLQMDVEPTRSQGTVSLPNLTALYLTGNVATIATLLSLVEVPVDIAHLVLSVLVPPELQSGVTAPASQVLLAASANVRSIGREDHLHNHLILPQVFKVTGQQRMSYSIEALSWDSEAGHDWAYYEADAPGPERRTAILWDQGPGVYPFGPNQWKAQFPFSFTKNVEGVWESHGWSTDSIRAFEAGVDVPESMWGQLSLCLQLEHLAFTENSVRTFLPFISGERWDQKTAGIPFPSLQTIVIEIGAEEGSGATVNGRFFPLDLILAKLVQVGLTGRQEFLASRGYISEVAAGGKWLLQRVEFKNCFCPLDKRVFDMLSAVSREVVWVERLERVSTPDVYDSEVEPTYDSENESDAQ
ncbi:hypothetical protein D9611_009847 [Ephemerocybe angulata]|uniref:F-box domain-containing protein n=1 Tax=Ephemerocybe angulata TaxID=980116 RepID=A0A8H5CCX8_9AGAR|nr:hypothetical protein D9611_009847 [Tulosesus angulatus]